MALTRPNPKMVDATFMTRAAFLAASLPSSVTYVNAAGRWYVRDASGTAATIADGSKWSPLDSGTPFHFGAVGDGVTDDQVALQAWIDWADGRFAFSGQTGYKVILDLMGYEYGLGDQLNIRDNTNGVIMMNGTLNAVGAGWDAVNDYVLANNSAYAHFYSITINCNDLCNGVRDNKGRTRWENLHIYRMKNVGYWKPSTSAGETRIFGAQIVQYVTTDAEFADQANFTAIGMLIEASDTKIHSSNIRFCGTCYKGTGGQQELYECHLVNGTGGAYARTNACLLVWDPASGTGSGELSLHNCYLDNGYCDIYDDQFNADCSVLLDAADADVDAFFRFYANGQNEPRHTATIKTKTWDATAYLFDWRAYDVYTWPDATPLANLRDQIQSSMASGNHRRQTIELHNEIRIVSTNSDGPAVSIMSPDTNATLAFRDADTGGTRPRMGCNGDDALITSATVLDIRAPAVLLDPQAAEPTTNVINGAIAVSNGTASTNGFGTSGAGLYFRWSGTWTKL